MRSDTEIIRRKINSLLMKADSYGRMKSFTIKELSQDINVNDKTIRKHIDLIRSGGTDLSGEFVWPKYIRDNYDEILKVDSGKHGTKSYSYVDIKINLFPDTMDESIIKELIPFVEYVNSIEGLDNFSRIAEIIEQIIDDQGLSDLLSSSTKKTLRIDSKPIFTLHNNEPVRDFLKLTRDAIVSQKCLYLRYAPFQFMKSSELIISPYLVMEHNNRWVIFGSIQKIFFTQDENLHKRIGLVSTFSFDRIYQFEVTDEHKYKPSSIKFNKILDKAYGYTGITWESPDYTNLVIKVKNSLIDYIHTKPIFSIGVPQKSKDGEDTILTYKNVQVTRELKMYFRSYADQIEVLEPKSLRDDVIKDLNKTVSLYIN